MLDEKQTCVVVHDLLPLYIEGLTAEESNQIIKKHLAKCSNCRVSYEMMKKEIVQDEKQLLEVEDVDRQVDYLKKIRTASHKKIGFAIGGTLSAFVIAILFKVFIWGSPTQNYTVAASVQEGNIKIQGAIKEGGAAYSHYKVVKKEGEKQLVIYTVKPFLWHNDCTFEIAYPLRKLEDKDLEMADKKLTKTGNIVSAYASQIYAKHHAYIGDVSKNYALAGTIGIASDLGAYTNELKTDQMPYKWQLAFETILEESNENLFNEKMQSYAMLLLASVDNLDEVGWSYTLEQGEKIISKRKKLSTKEADQILDTSVKKYGQSEEGIEALLTRIGISDRG